MSLSAKRVEAARDEVAILRARHREDLPTLQELFILYTLGVEAGAEFVRQEAHASASLAQAIGGDRRLP